MGLVWLYYKKINRYYFILYLVLLFIIAISLFYIMKISYQYEKEALTLSDSSEIINKIAYDDNSDSIKKLNTLRSVISMMNIQDTYTYNSIIFDTTLSDDAKIIRVKQLVDNIIANNIFIKGRSFTISKALIFLKLRLIILKIHNRWSYKKLLIKKLRQRNTTSNVANVEIKKSYKEDKSNYIELQSTYTI